MNCVDLRALAERLISAEAASAKSSATNAPASFAVIEMLSPQLAQIIGDDGLRALLARALVLANADVAWLHTVHVKSDGSFENLDELEAQVDPKDIAEGRVVLLSQLLGLLTKLVGERLMLQLVFVAAPKLSKVEVGFVKGDEDEKK